MKNGLTIVVVKVVVWIFVLNCLILFIEAVEAIEVAEVVRPQGLVIGEVFSVDILEMPVEILTR